MRTDDAVSFFGTKKKIADLLGITQSALQQWGPIVPLISAMRLEELSFGNVKVLRDKYDERGKPIKEAA